MAAQSDRQVLLADSSKWGKSGFVTVMPLAAIDLLITDRDFDPVQAAALREAGLEVNLA
jgi:DeoR/GlpR family transcriptional regulator of sugar metabolism